MMDVMAVILAGGVGSRLSILASERAKPAVPFGARYRIIDFTLSNCLNSGIRKVGIIAQYAPRSLVQHLGDGRPWGLDYPSGEFIMLQPYLTRTSGEWYRGTADAIYQNLRFIQESTAREVLVLAGDHVYTMRYDCMVTFHRQHEADITMGAVRLPPRESASKFGVLELGDQGEVARFEEKPAAPRSNLASMGIYVFNKDTLIDCLREEACIVRESHDIGHHVIPAAMSRYGVFGYEYEGYWRDVGTIESYWQANMDLAEEQPMLDLHDTASPVVSGWHAEPPVRHAQGSSTGRSLVSSGCVIKGNVWNSVLSTRVLVEEGASVYGSVIFDGTYIGSGAVLNKCIVDKQVWIGPGACVGLGDDNTPNKDEPDNLNSGITVVGKGARIPAGARIGRNCKVMPWVQEQDFASLALPSGETVTGRHPYPEAMVCPA